MQTPDVPSELKIFLITPKITSVWQCLKDSKVNNHLIMKGVDCAGFPFFSLRGKTFCEQSCFTI